MASATYTARRGELEEYFDRTAAAAWAALTSDAPVGRIRATVRAGRDRMRATLLGYLPADLTGARVLDAGCGTGALAQEAARRGAHVVAVDISPTLIRLAQERMAESDAGAGSVHFAAGDMLDPSLGDFDWVVAMDSLIHYEADDVVEVLASLAARARQGVVFTFAPSTPLLSVMHTIGKAFPRGNRSPDIAPIRERALRERLAAHAGTASLRVGQTERIESGFYTSQAMELVRS